MVEKNPILEKYSNITSSGLQAFHEGTVEPFKGFVGLENRFNVSLKLGELTSTADFNLLLDELDKIKHFSGAFFIRAGTEFYNFPIHSTILEGLYEGTNSDERNEIFQVIKDDQRIDEVRSTLPANSVVFDHLLPSKETILIAASKIPDSILNARNILTGLYTEHGLRPLAMDNILHSSMARMIQLPRQDLSDQFVARLMSLHQDLQINPITAGFDEVFVGTAHQILGKY